MTVNTPKDPIDGVTEWTNEETGIKYRYIGGAWRAVSSKAAQDVADALGQLDLQKVLDNGNQADKGATFGGKVEVEPGENANQAIVYEQYKELQDSIVNLQQRLKSSVLYLMKVVTTTAN